MTVSLREAALVLLLFSLGASVGSFATRSFAGVPVFYQAEFGPAVMVAAGRGFVNPRIAPGSPLAEFLAQQRQGIDRADVMDTGTIAVDHYQHETRYLMLALGYVWRISGISWAAAARLGGLLCGLTVVACYAIVRPWLGQVFATVGALLMAMSPLHLQQLPHLRDYSKAPFILFALALIAVISVRPLSRRALLVMSALCGAVIGLGLGFRMDVLAMAPIAIASLWLFRDRRPWTGLADKAFASGALLAALVIAGAPVFVPLGTKGSNGFHVIVLGYADPFDADLGLTRPAYSLLPYYDDTYADAVLGESGRRATGVVPAYQSAAYDAAGRAYWLQIVRHFPADIAIRTLGATNRILNLPFDVPTLDFLTAARGGNGLLGRLLTNQAPRRAGVDVLFGWLAVLNGWGTLFGVVLVAAAAAESARLGVFVAWVVLATAGYSSLQFADRHIFHLQIIPILSVLAAVALLSRARSIDRGVVRRVATVLAVLAAAVAAPVWLLRLYQSSHLVGLFETYLAAPREPVESSLQDTGYGTSRIRLPLSPPIAGGHRVPDYYVVEFDGAAAGTTAAIEIHYTHAPGPDRYSRVVSMLDAPGVTRMFVPAYGQDPDFAFDGLELSPSARNRLRGIYRVTRQPSLLLDLQLAGGWERSPLYQRLWSDPGSETDPIHVGGAPEGAMSRLAWIGRLDAPGTRPDPAAVKVFYTKDARVTGEAIAMDGAVASQSTYLLGFKAVRVDAPSALLVQGHLSEGGVSFGVLKGANWAAQTVITAPGDFIAVIDVPGPGTFEALVTSAARRDGDRVRFTMSRFGIVTAEAGH